MPLFSSFFGSSTGVEADASAKVLKEYPSLHDERDRSLEAALEATTLIMHDDIEGAERELEKGDSVYHKLGLGLAVYMKATLGYERDVISDAASKLAVAEAAALEAQTRVQRGKLKSHSTLYPSGTEYILCHAEAQIMSGVVGILAQSLTEAFKGIYKLRKAIVTLQNIAAAENRIMLDASGSTPATRQTSEVEKPKGDDGHDDGAIQDASSSQRNNRDAALASSISKIDPSLLTNPTDELIHSGYRLHHGLILVLLSLVPPSMTRILSIVGFRGDRDRGLTLLWEATNMHLSPAAISPDGATSDNRSGGKDDSISGSRTNSAIAGLVLLGYYSNLVSLMDILPRHSYPKQRTALLLHTMLAEFPQSKFWKLEHSRRLASDKDLHAAIRVLEDAEPASSLKQVEALRWEEHGLDCAYTHAYAKCAESFLRCVELDSWSVAFAYYVAAAAHVDLYRMAKYSTANADPAAAEQYADRAEELFGKVPAHLGKKKMMARPIPFEAFVGRKIGKWTKRAEQWGVRLVDAIGVSPIEEICFFWAGYKRMDEDMLRTSLEKLWWSDGGVRDVVGSAKPAMQSNPHADREGLDEHAVLALLRASVYRRFGNTDASRKLLAGEIIEGHSREEFKGEGRESWTSPVARYEMAVCAWMESGESEESRSDVVVDRETRGQRLRECSKWLEEAAGWESYELDSRMNIKVNSGRETLKKMEIT